MIKPAKIQTANPKKRANAVSGSAGMIQNEIAQTHAPMIPEDTVDLAVEVTMLLNFRRPIFCLKALTRRPRFRIDAIDVASASPPCRSEVLIRIMPSTILTEMDMTAIFTGVFVSCNA